MSVVEIIMMILLSIVGGVALSFMLGIILYVYNFIKENR